jgi:GntR family transcriptional regulator, transcriptional repressor for pyruvate dehydrogenase complex
VTTPSHNLPGGTARRRRILGASEQVAAEIQHHIQVQGLGPGDFLGREEDLAAEFGVSRPTLREALKLLVSGNLVRATKGPGGGIFVLNTAADGMSRSLSDAIAMMLETGDVELRELLDARLLLEVPLAGRAAHAADQAAVEQLRRSFREAMSLGDGDHDAIAQIDAEIHRVIAAAAGNRMVEALTRWIYEIAQPALMRVLHNSVLPGAVQAQLQTLLEAIEKGDARRAERAMKDHLLYLRDVLAMVDERASPPPR